MSSTPAHKIALASDHAGFDLKSRIVGFLREQGHDVLDLGATSTDPVDYPDYGQALAKAIAAGEADLGIGICGTGIGISIALNRHPVVRAALCWNEETARLARLHNDANVLALGARVIDPETALACVKVFLSTGFEGGRHARRVEKLSSCG